MKNLLRQEMREGEQPVVSLVSPHEISISNMLCQWICLLVFTGILNVTCTSVRQIFTDTENLTVHMKFRCAVMQSTHLVESGDTALHVKLLAQTVGPDEYCFEHPIGFPDGFIHWVYWFCMGPVVKVVEMLVVGADVLGPSELSPPVIGPDSMYTLLKYQSSAPEFPKNMETLFEDIGAWQWQQSLDNFERLKVETFINNEPAS